MKVLLLVGSPRKAVSTSDSIGQYMVANLKNGCCTYDTIYIYDALKSNLLMNSMVDSFNESDVIILTYPLYVDSLPAPCIEALECITKQRQNIAPVKKQLFLAIGNCGFYDKEQIENSLNVCSFFAKENNLDWYGCIPIGGGPQLDGKKLETLGGMTVKLRKALDMASDSILQSAPLPIDKIIKLTDPPEPRFMYSLIANFSFKAAARKNGTLKKINAKPFIE